ncbi:Outer capsid protein [Dirofilaria immitis]
MDQIFCSHAITEALPEDVIDYNWLKIIFTALEYEYNIVEDSKETSFSAALIKNSTNEYARMALHSLHNTKRKKKSTLLK